jgi:hypothetical protein
MYWALLEHNHLIINFQICLVICFVLWLLDLAEL